MEIIDEESLSNGNDKILFQIHFFEPESFNRNKLVYRIPVKASKQNK